MKSYCTQNNGDCETCGLVNYGKDCQNNPLKKKNETLALRLSAEDREKAEQQASKLGLNISEYIRLIINLDAATEIIKRLKESE